MSIVVQLRGTNSQLSHTTFVRLPHPSNPDSVLHQHVRSSSHSLGAVQSSIHWHGW